jgi:hypothetical protein
MSGIDQAAARAGEPLAMFQGKSSPIRHYALAAPTGECRADVFDHLEMAGGVVENFGHILAHLAHLAAE